MQQQRTTKRDEYLNMSDQGTDASRPLLRRRARAFVPAPLPSSSRESIGVKQTKSMVMLTKQRGGRLLSTIHLKRGEWGLQDSKPRVLPPHAPPSRTLLHLPALSSKDFEQLTTTALTGAQADAQRTFTRSL